MITYNVINWNFNQDKIEHLDIMPYIYDSIKEAKKRDKLKNADITYDWLKEVIDSASKYMYWARCQYEVIVHAWPVRKNDHKLDVYEQIKMNLDNITRLIYDDMFGKKKKTRQRTNGDKPSDNGKE